jgi:hypothetical protein
MSLRLNLIFNLLNVMDSKLRISKSVHIGTYKFYLLGILSFLPSFLWQQNLLLFFFMENPFHVMLVGFAISQGHMNSPSQRDIAYCLLPTSAHIDSGKNSN